MTASEVLEAIRKYVLRAFDPATSLAVVASAPGTADEIAAGLGSAGYSVERRTLDVSEEDAGSDGSSSSESD